MATLPTNAGEIQPRHRKFASAPGLYLRNDIDADQKTTDPVIYNADGAITFANAPVEMTEGIARSQYIEVFYDFLQIAGGTLPVDSPYLLVHDTSSAGTPVAAFLSGSKVGEWQYAHDNTDEAQYIGLQQNDAVWIDPTKGPIFETRVKLNFGGATLSADQRFVCGLASARDNTLDDVVDHAWFRIEGASLSILYESDDGATDDNANDSGVVLVDDTYVILKIDMSDLSAVAFSINGTEVGTTDMSAIAAGDKLQIFYELQKDAGTETDLFAVDYLHLVVGR